MKRAHGEDEPSVVRPVDVCLMHTGIEEALAGIKRTLNALLVLHGVVIAGLVGAILKGCTP